MLIQIQRAQLEVEQARSSAAADERAVRTHVTADVQAIQGHDVTENAILAKGRQGVEAARQRTVEIQ